MGEREAGIPFANNVSSDGKGGEKERLEEEDELVVDTEEGMEE